MRILGVLLLSACCTTPLLAQEPDTTAVDDDYIEEDFSIYADAEIAGGGKRFCTSKVYDQSPNKLVSVGWDFQGSHTLTLDALGDSPAQELDVQSVQGFRFSANFPVVSKTNVLINLGVNYWESHYTIDNSDQHTLAQALQDRALRTTGLLATVFKPLNETHFILVQGAANLSGDYFFPDFQPLNLTRYSATFIYGWKKHDRLLYGFGLTRTYRIGEANYVPVLLYNYTFPSRAWGIEAAFPARANLRRNFSSRSLAFIGYELEGQSYRIESIEGIGGIADPELRRSELRIRATFEHSLKDFIWVSAQLGLRYNWNFNLDDGDLFRGFGDEDYALENDLTNALYFNVSLNLVSP